MIALSSHAGHSFSAGRRRETDDSMFVRSWSFLPVGSAGGADDPQFAPYGMFFPVGSLEENGYCTLEPCGSFFPGGKSSEKADDHTDAPRGRFFCWQFGEKPIIALSQQFLFRLRAGGKPI